MRLRFRGFLAACMAFATVAQADFEGREIVRASVPLTRYEPRDTAVWDDGFAKWLDIRNRKA